MLRYDTKKTILRLEFKMNPLKVVINSKELEIYNLAYFDFSKISRTS